MWEICDVHGHFLPHMDDGCKTAEDSLGALRMSAQQGVTHMIATPHYYPVEPISAFLERREKSWEELRPQIEQTMPRVVLGAEVYYFPGISNGEDLEKLCISGTRYLLLEMPFSPWTGVELRDLRSICNVRGLQPILAHLERYLDIEPKSILEEILEEDVLVQINAGCLPGTFSGRTGRNLIKNGIVQFIGSDCHNLTTRRPNLGEAMATLQKHGMQQELEQLAKNSMELIAHAEVY